MKKEYIILAIVIVALGLYLFLQRKDQVHFQLPTLETVKSTVIDRIVVAKEGNTIELKKKDDKWFIEPKNYPADPSAVDEMLTAGTKLTITALVSKSANYERYDLSEGKKINVQFYKDGKKRRDFDVGRGADTYQHTFVKLDGDKQVYHARGSLDRTFDRTVERLRDKTVLSFDEKSITELTVQKGDKQIALIQKQDAEKTETDEKDGEKKAAPAKKQWVDEAGGGPVDQTAVERLLGSFSRLQCESFLEDTNKTDVSQPVWTLTFKGNDQTYAFSVFGARDDSGDKDQRPAISSVSDYVFLLSTSRIQSFEKHVDNLLGIEPEPKEAVSGQSKSGS